MSVVLLDALGTLVAFAPPVPHLVAELAHRGVVVSAEAAERAMRAEIAHYRSAHDRADSAATLAVLRRECAEIVQAELGAAAAGARIDDVEAALLAAVRFAAYPDAEPALRALRADGEQLVVLSNWDVSLHDVLAATGLMALVDAAISSAEAGVAKPSPAIFARALALVGGTAADAVMVGDSLDTDVAGALAAGIAPVLITRGRAASAGAAAVPAGVDVLEGLGGLPALVRYRRLPRCPPPPRPIPAPPIAAPELPRRGRR